MVQFMVASTEPNSLPDLEGSNLCLTPQLLHLRSGVIALSRFPGRVIVTDFISRHSAEAIHGISVSHYL